jgi:hypothetical protein
MLGDGAGIHAWYVTSGIRVKGVHTHAHTLSQVALSQLSSRLKVSCVCVRSHLSLVGILVYKPPMVLGSFMQCT